MLKISVDKKSYAPGETIAASITLVLEKPVKARGIFAQLYCNEQKIEDSFTIIDDAEKRRIEDLGLHVHSTVKEVKSEVDEELFLQEKQVGNQTEYASGTFACAFTLPQDAPPTSYEFGADKKIHIWHLCAKLDVPFAPDMNDEIEILVSGLDV